MPMSIAAVLPRGARGRSASTCRGAALALVACAAAPSTIGFLAASGPGLLSVAPARSATASTSGAMYQGSGEASPISMVGAPPISCATLCTIGAVAGALSAVVGKHRRRQRASISGCRAEKENDEDNDVPLEIRGFSLSQVALGLGVFLTLFSLLDYTVLSSAGSGLGLGGITLIYAIPATVLGLSLLYAEIPPVDVEVESGADGLFEAKATPTLRTIKKDITRHRYGDDAHLDTSLKALGLDGTARYPQMKKFIESKSPEGELEITMLFESKDVPFTTWSDPLKIVACDRFFGPGIWTQIYKYSSEKRIAALKLTTGTKPERATSPASNTAAKEAATA